MLRALLAAALVVLPPAAFPAGPAAPAGDGAVELTAAEYHDGLKTLRGYLEKRGLEAEAAERFIAVMATALPASKGERVPVTRAVFAAFLRYEAAWARKTRDGKNPKVTAAQHEGEARRADELKERFRLLASEGSPVFYRVFQAAVREVRGAKGRRPGDKSYAGNSAVFFGDQVDNSYSHVDAGDVALENGDTAGAIAEAGKALAENPGNADAFVLRAGAEYDRRDFPAAIADAQSALLLDPSSRQALAILSLAGKDGAALPAPSDEPAPSATPAVGAMLSRDITSRAVDGARSDARSSVAQLDQAITLNPRNASARGWRSALLNRLGEYASALASAEQSLTGNPRDGAAYFNKAYALAGRRDKAGTLAALAQAAKVDPAYQPVLDSALQLPRADDMEILFGGWAESHPLEAPPSRRPRFPLPLLLLGGTGGFMALAGVAQLFRRGR